MIIIDRKEDPVTPLLIHWNYQSLLHDLLGIDDNKVVLNGKEYNLNH